MFYFILRYKHILHFLWFSEVTIDLKPKI